MVNKNKVRRNKFIRMFLMSLAIFSVIAALATTVYVLVAKNNLLSKVLQNPVLKNEDPKTSAKDKAFTVTALFGVDQLGSNQTNTNMLLFFNHKNQEINVVSVPRDTKFNWPEEVYNEISAKRKDIPKIVPISEVPSYVAAEKRNEIAVQVLENAFHMNIDYYINMDLAAFKYLVDVAGPVTMEVPEMIFTDTAKNGNSDVAKGLQPLDGEKAAALLQYSPNYSGGDLNRIKVQQAFFKAFMDQILKPENKVNLPSTLKGLYPYIQTNFENAADYLVYLEEISTSKLFMGTLPGSLTPDKKYAYDAAKSKELFETILTAKNLMATEPANQPKENTTLPSSQTTNENTPQPPVTLPTEPKESDTNVIVKEVYDVKIMAIGVYNGTNISGLAAKTKQRLEALGYKVAQVGNYQTKPVEKTLIKVYAKEIGEELLPYFSGGVIQVDESLKGKPEEIVIVLGLTEQK